MTVDLHAILFKSRYGLSPYIKMQHNLAMGVSLLEVSLDDHDLVYDKPEVDSCGQPVFIMDEETGELVQKFITIPYPHLAKGSIKVDFDIDDIRMNSKILSNTCNSLEIVGFNIEFSRDDFKEDVVGLLA